MRFASFVVDTAGLAADDRAAVCRLVVRTLQAMAVRFEADIPWSGATAWPSDVSQAADTLANAAGRRHSNGPYRRTGMTRRADEEVWQAFATFAGYAFDASVWSDDHVLPMVSLSDEGTSVVVRVSQEERRHLEAVVEPVRVIPLKEARAERRGSR